MSSILSYETAKRLKDAGFPQPEIKVGQFWYSEPAYKGGNLEHVPLCIVVERYSNREKCLRRLTCEHMTGEVAGSPQCFAPTATDILRELGDDFCLFTSTMKSAMYWCCNESSDAFDDKERYCTPIRIANPGEAAALAWLSINEKCETK